MFWLAYLYTVIVGGTFAVLRVLRKVLRRWGQATNSKSKTRPSADQPIHDPILASAAGHRELPNLSVQGSNNNFRVLARHVTSMVKRE
jgi:hypothetical protein